MACRDHRDAAGGALDHDIGEALRVAVARGDAGCREQGRAAHPFRHLADILCAEELRLHAKLARLPLQGGAQRTVADHDQPDARHPRQGGKQIRRPLLLDQPADMEDRPRLARPFARLEAIEIDAVVMRARPLRRIAERHRLAPERVRDGEEQIALVHQPLALQRIAAPARSPGGEQGGARAGHVIAAQMGDERQPERAGEAQHLQPVRAEMSVDQLRLRRPEPRLDAPAPPRRRECEPLGDIGGEDHPLLQLRRDLALALQPDQQRPPPGQRGRLVLDEALGRVEQGGAEDRRDGPLYLCLGSGHSAWSTAAAPDTSAK